MSTQDYHTKILIHEDAHACLSLHLFKDKYVQKEESLTHTGK